MFSDGFAWGFPPRAYGLEAYLRLLEDQAPGAPWMIPGLDVDIRALIDPAVERGGHLRVGLEDAAFGERRSNLQQVEEARRAVERAGGSLAVPGEVRAALTSVDPERVDS